MKLAKANREETYPCISCIFYHSGNVTCGNETLSLKCSKRILCYGFIKSYPLANDISHTRIRDFRSSLAPILRNIIKL